MTIENAMDALQEARVCYLEQILPGFFYPGFDPLSVPVRCMHITNRYGIENTHALKTLLHNERLFPGTRLAFTESTTYVLHRCDAFIDPTKMNLNNSNGCPVVSSRVIRTARIPPTIMGNGHVHDVLVDFVFGTVVASKNVNNTIKLHSHVKRLHRNDYISWLTSPNKQAKPSSDWFQIQTFNGPGEGAVYWNWAVTVVSQLSFNNVLPNVMVMLDDGLFGCVNALTAFDLSMNDFKHWRKL